MLLPYMVIVTTLFAVRTLTLTINKSFHGKFNTSLKIMFIYKGCYEYNSLKHNIVSPSFLTQPVLK